MANLNDLQRYDSGDDMCSDPMPCSSGPMLKFEDVKEFLKTSHNSDYTTALKVTEEFESIMGIHTTVYQLKAWLSGQHLNSDKPNCA